jgi:nitrate reductase beta subunit
MPRSLLRGSLLPTFEERFVIPPMAREVAIEAVRDPFKHKAEAGTGFRRAGEEG